MKDKLAREAIRKLAQLLNIEVGFYRDYTSVYKKGSSIYVENLFLTKIAKLEEYLGIEYKEKNDFVPKYVKREEK